MKWEASVWMKVRHTAGDWSRNSPASCSSSGYNFEEMYKERLENLIWSDLIKVSQSKRLFKTFRSLCCEAIFSSQQTLRCIRALYQGLRFLICEIRFSQLHQLFRLYSFVKYEMKRYLWNFEPSWSCNGDFPLKG